MVAFGRVVQHDPRSRAFPVAAGPVGTRHHYHHGPVLDQGMVGSCTGNALAQALNTGPLKVKARPVLDEAAAVRLYSAATRLDPFPGEYPPTDTGSSGLAVCKAAMDAGLLSGYRHAFSLNDALGALTAQPVIVGVDWYTGMLNPDRNGYLHPTGVVEGGHEVALVGINATLKRVTILNSWGPEWGRRGRALLSFDDLGRLLADQGDCTVPDVQFH